MDAYVSPLLQIHCFILEFNSTVTKFNSTNTEFNSTVTEFNYRTREFNYNVTFHPLCPDNHQQELVPDTFEQPVNEKKP